MRRLLSAICTPPRIAIGRSPTISGTGTRSKVIEDLFRAMHGLLILLRHSGELRTHEQLKEAGIEPVRYSNPPPWVFNHGRHHHHHGG